MSIYIDTMRATAKIKALGYKLSFTHAGDNGQKEATATAVHTETGETFVQTADGNPRAIIRLGDELMKLNYERLAPFKLPEAVRSRFDRAACELSVTSRGLSGYKYKTQERATVPIRQKNGRAAAEKLAELLHVDDDIAEHDRQERAAEEAYQRFLAGLKPFSPHVLRRLAALGVDHITASAITRKKDSPFQGEPYVSISTDEVAELVMEGWEQICQQVGHRLGVGEARDYFWLMALSATRHGCEYYLQHRDGLNKAWLHDLERGNVPMF